MGGVAGHMAHLSEDTELTFNEIVDILGKVANAEIDNATEKVDGQNLFLTVDSSGEIKTARNAGDVRKGGMTTDEYISKWKGHPAENAFTNGFKAVSAALRKLTGEDLEAIFADGERYVNMEIMYPKNPNIILYSSPNVVLHGLQYFGAEDETPEMRQLTKQRFTKLAGLIDVAIETVGQEQWGVNGPKMVPLKKIADGTALEDVTSKIQQFAAPVGMDATVGDYVELVVRKYAEQVDLPQDITDKLITLMLHPDEAKEQGITVVKLKKGLPKELQTTVSNLGSKTKSRKYIASVLNPLEVAISDFAIEVLRGVKSYFVSDNDEEVARMRAELEQSIAYLKNLQASGDDKMGALIDKQLSKLGNIENLASSMEGVVFEYPPGSDNIYKLTGAFAMANQIIGRARRSGMTENETQSNDFTIHVSKDKHVTKSLQEWLDEIKGAEHKYTKLPQSVYEDILDGMPIVDIVSEENALPTVYNAVVGYVKGILEEQDDDFPTAHDWYEWRHYADQDLGLPLDDEDEDPVVDSDYPKTVAVVPGAFKPPHKGHLAMVEQYAGMADEVIVLISRPTKGGRYLPNGKEITAEDSKAIWELLTADIPNVDIFISTHASPLTAAYEYVGKDGPLPEGTKVILGASTKGGDVARWKGAEQYIKDGVELMSPAETAVVPTTRPEGEPYSATDLRNALGDPENNRAEIADFVGEENVDNVLKLLGLTSEIEEISGMAGGGMAGGAGAFPGKRDKDEEEREPSIIRHENIDLSIVDDVIRLIMEKGIAR